MKKKVKLKKFRESVPVHIPECRSFPPVSFELANHRETSPLCDVLAIKKEGSRIQWLPVLDMP